MVAGGEVAVHAADGLPGMGVPKSRALFAAADALRLGSGSGGAMEALYVARGADTAVPWYRDCASRKPHGWSSGLSLEGALGWGPRAWGRYLQVQKPRLEFCIGA